MARPDPTVFQLLNPSARAKLNKLLKTSDSSLFKKVQMRGARKIDERRRIY
jgi:hypothetical protein